MNVNRDQHYDYYTTLNEKRFYNLETRSKDKATTILKFENNVYVKESKNLFEVFQKANTLMGKVFNKPCQNLEKEKILAKPKTK